MVNRINGFSNSGLNIDDLVSKLMKAERIPLDKFKQKRQTLEWQRDDYRDINKTMLDFRNMAFNMKLESTYNSRKASSADESVVSATATSSANPGSYTVKVNQLAEAATLTSNAVGGNSAKTTLASLGIASNAELTIKGEKGAATILVNTSTTDDLSSLVNSVNAKSSITGVSVNYDETLGRFFWSSTATGKNAEVNLQTLDNNLLTQLGITPAASTATSERTVAAGAAVFASSDPVNGAIVGSETLRITYDGTTFKDFTITNTTTIGDLINQINSSDIGKAGVSAYLDAAGKLSFFNPDASKALVLSDQTGGGEDLVASLGMDSTVDVPIQGQTIVATGTAAFSSSSVKVSASIATSETLRITYGGTTKDFTVTSATTIGQLIDNINNSDLGKAGISAYLDSAGKLKFFSPDSSKGFTISDQTPGGVELLSAIGMDTSNASVPAAYQIKFDKGLNLKVALNTTDVEYSSNTFAFNGINFTAKKVDAGAKTVQVTQDTDAIFNSIKSFIDKYNETIDKLNGELNEEKYKDYQPLTDEQRESLSEDQIKKWEDKAKSGLLHGDSILKDAVYNIRSSFTGTVTGLSSGDLSDLSQIGIGTKFYYESGKLYIDETKLKDAIANKPDEVMALFRADDGNSKKTTDGDGVAVRLYDRITSVMDQLKDKAGSSSESLLNTYTIGKSILDLSSRINSFEDRLTAVEDRYYRQFTAMEQALSQMNQQSASLLQGLQ